MAKRISHSEALCGVARPLDAIGDWWSLLIVRDAFDGLRRFGEFQQSLGLAKNILSARLRGLIAHGIMDTVPAADGSRFQDYVLTEKGRGLFLVLAALRQWGEDFFFEPDEQPRDPRGQRSRTAGAASRTSRAGRTRASRRRHRRAAACGHSKETRAQETDVIGRLVR